MDQTAQFERFAAQHHGHLGRVAYLLTMAPDAADQLMIDTLVAVWRRWRTVSQSDDPEREALYVMVRLMTGGSRYGGRRRRPFARDTPAAGPEHSQPSLPDTGQALAALPVRRRMHLVLHHVAGLSEPQIAALLGASPVKVADEIAQAVGQLRTLLGEGPAGWARGFDLLDQHAEPQLAESPRER